MGKGVVKPRRKTPDKEDRLVEAELTQEISLAIRRGSETRDIGKKSYDET